MIRNELVLLFSSKTYAALNTREGKEELQSQALASVRSVLQKEAGTQDVEAVFFTSLVMQ
jgi:flagellar FliL protein